jgi:signal transduction histidine kinase
MTTWQVCQGFNNTNGKDLQIIEDSDGAREAGNTRTLNGIEICVADTGIGIESEDQERIFDPFEQVENSASRRYQGTGLGLSLTKNLVALHGGKIWVESEGKGKGAAFHFILPIFARN